MSKNIENVCQNRPKMEPKSMPKLIKNQCKHGTEKLNKNTTNTVFLKGKNT